MTFRPGELDQVVEALRKTLTPDGMGGNTESFSQLFEDWCHVRPLTGRESTDYDRVNASARYLFVFRYYDGFDLQSRDILVWEGDRYNIRVVKKPKLRDLYVQIEAERGVAL